MKKEEGGGTDIWPQVFNEVNAIFPLSWVLIAVPWGRMEKVKHEMVGKLVLTMSSPLKHWTKGTLWRMSEAGLSLSLSL